MRISLPLLDVRSRIPGPPVPSDEMKTIPASSSADWIDLNVVTFVPNPFSNRLTVFGDMPARFPKSRTPQPKAALAIRTCDGVSTMISRKRRWLTITYFWSTLYSKIGVDQTRWLHERAGAES